MAVRRVLVGLGTASIPCAGAAFYYRPEPSGELLEARSDISRRLKSPKNLSDHASDPDPLFLRAARATVSTIVISLSKVVLLKLNKTRVVEDKRHSKLLELMRNRPEGEPLLTVANHASTLDDPAVMAVLMPWKVALNPNLIRWSVCAQEICFETPVLSAFFGAGKVLPIERGGGVDQKSLLDFSRRLVAGGWCHIFPEGRTVQTGEVGSRSPSAAEDLGSLKWGVGKMVAHAPRTPQVVPFFHTGMQNLVAEHPVTKDILPRQPHLFNDITVRVGDPIDLSDLLAEHEAENGPLWKLSSGVADRGVADERKWAASSSAERELYSAITKRVEDALLALEAEAKAELGDDYPMAPEVVASGDYVSLVKKQ